MWQFQNWPIAVRSYSSSMISFNPSNFFSLCNFCLDFGFVFFCVCLGMHVYVRWILRNVLCFLNVVSLCLLLWSSWSRCSARTVTVGPCGWYPGPQPGTCAICWCRQPTVATRRTGLWSSCIQPWAWVRLDCTLSKHCPANAIGIPIICNCFWNARGLSKGESTSKFWQDETTGVRCPYSDSLSWFGFRLTLTWEPAYQVALQCSCPTLCEVFLSPPPPERVLEDHEVVVEVQAAWPSESDTKLLFRKNYAKYEFFRTPVVGLLSSSASSTILSRKRSHFQAKCMVTQRSA